MRAGFTPKDAHRLLLDAGVTRHACDVVRNPAFCHADARTTDAHGKRVVDYVRSGAEREAWPGRIMGLLGRPSSEFGAAMALEPVKLTSIPKSDGGERLIGVPTFLRRCVSNVFQEVLARTGDHLLPASVRAYRPGSDDTVRHAILDVAHAVREGRVTHFANLDFSSYFSLMPWTGIEAALQHYGFSKEFTERLMQLVRCPLVRREHRRYVEVPNARGAQMGLPESSSLANMLVWELDAHFERLSPCVTYLRYSDDLFIGSPHRSDVVGAVGTVQSWCRRQRIHLRDVSPDQRAGTLVHDVRQARIDFLGAEIDVHGRVHLPLAKLKTKLEAIQHRIDHLAADGLIEAVSRYGDGGGTDRFDLDDVVEMIEGFVSYWTPLDPEGARHADALLNKMFPFARPSRSGTQGIVWVARLWGTQANAGAEAIDPLVHHAERPTGMPCDTSASGTDPTGAGPASSFPIPDTPPPHSPGAEVDGPMGRQGGLPEPSGSSVVDAHADARRPEHFTSVNPEAVIPWESAVSPGMEEEQLASSHERDDDPSACAEGRMTHRLLVSSMEDSGDLDLNLDLISRALDGAEADPAQDEPPVPPVFANLPIVYIVAERLAVAGPPATVVVTGVALNGYLLGSPSATVVTGRRDAAVIRRATELVVRAATGLVITVGDSRLVKRLIQPHRRVRAPGMFALVNALHDAARGRGIDVRVAAGLPAPAGLLRQLRDAVRHEVCARQHLAVAEHVASAAPTTK